MKSFMRIFIAAILITSISACISSKKYKDEVARREAVEKREMALQEDYQKLSKDLKQLQGKASAGERELTEKERMLADEQRRMAEMKALVDGQRNAIRNLKQEVCSALKCFTPEELQIEVRNGKLYVSISDKLLFPSGSDVVNKRGMEAIAMLAAVLRNSDLEVMVEGHTDPVPINTSRNHDNWDLSVHRATSVTRIFTENGIPAQRIIASGRGPYHPLAENETAEGRQVNRRTEIVLAPKLDKLWKLTEQEDVTTTKK
ncbi:MAG TPA: OmpA family protein [Bacteroidia bacterium]|nr:OmpA family protein [Bacteroidia bacterium]